jgi:hypothetical protein
MGNSSVNLVNLTVNYLKELLDMHDMFVKGTDEKRLDRNTYNDVAGDRLQPALDKI